MNVRKQYFKGVFFERLASIWFRFLSYGLVLAGLQIARNITGSLALNILYGISLILMMFWIVERAHNILVRSRRKFGFRRGFWLLTSLGVGIIIGVGYFLAINSFVEAVMALEGQAVPTD